MAALATGADQPPQRIGDGGRVRRPDSPVRTPGSRPVVGPPI